MSKEKPTKSDLELLKETLNTLKVEYGEYKSNYATIVEVNKGNKWDGYNDLSYLLTFNSKGELISHGAVEI